jgi:hypothetical protein
VQFCTFYSSSEYRLCSVYIHTVGHLLGKSKSLNRNFKYRMLGTLHRDFTSQSTDFEVVNSEVERCDRGQLLYSPFSLEN